MLAPFLDRQSLADILGRDLFADPGQIAGFADLMSDDTKPFECVGERRESAAALRLLSFLPEWQDSPVVAALSGPARALVGEDDVAALLTPAEGTAGTDSPLGAALGDDVLADVHRLLTEGL